MTNAETLAHWQAYVETLVAEPEVQAFQQAEQKIEQHQQIHALREAIKQEQKALVNAKHYEKQAAAIVHQQQIAQLEAELELIPLWHQYQQLQTEVNQLLQEVITTIESELA